MNFKKRVNGSWTDIPHYIHKTDTDTITTLPADIYANDVTATVGLKGNMYQASGVSPTTPIQPSECGERSSNLYNVSDKSATTNSLVTLVDLGADTTFNTFTVSCMFDNLLATSTTGAFLDFLKDDNTHQYASLGNMYNVADNTPCIANTILTGNYYTTKNNLTFRYIKAYLFSTAYNKFQSGTIKWAFYDSEKKDYEPYGYKIPILSANTTTPVYLGEVETTRKIRKLVLTGNETGWTNVGGNAPYRLSITGIVTSLSTLSIEWCCSHYLSLSINDSWSSYDYCISRTSTTAQSLQFRDTNQTTLADFKSYLAQQYAAGTPVCVWYVLANPETAVVNEPIRKIGDYADTVSGITIPTIAGANTIDVDTTLKPSEVTATYKGWHPVNAVHERESGQWD